LFLFLLLFFKDVILSAAKDLQYLRNEGAPHRRFLKGHGFSRAVGAAPRAGTFLPKAGAQAQPQRRTPSGKPQRPQSQGKPQALSSPLTLPSPSNQSRMSHFPAKNSWQSISPNLLS
jgi:hypothetical protein